jgi:cell division protein FtsZ
MQGAGSALMGIGSARGEDRAVQAAELAISSPLLEASIDGAHGVLLSIQGGSDLGLFEINEAARLVQEAAHPDANIIFGTVIDDALGDEVRVTVIAAGFDGGGPVRRNDDRALGQVAGSTQRPAMTPGAAQQPRVVQPSLVKAQVFNPVPVPGGTQTPAGQTPGNGAQPSAVHPQPSEPVPVAVARPPRTVIFDDNDDLDVPDFLK